MQARPSHPVVTTSQLASLILPLAPLLLLLLLPSAVDAQNGDRRGEEQPENWRAFDIPPAPVLSPEEAQADFRLPPGFRIEAAATEPLIVDPVAVRFDRAGRLWAVEMRSYMPTVTGEGEMEPRGQVVVLEDEDEDGIFDRSTVFLGGLVNARAIAHVEGGVLVAEPPSLWYCRDVDGDLRCDWRVELGPYGDPNPDNLEHTENALLRGPDGWLWNSKSTRKLRVTLAADGSPRLEVRETDFRGQWGLSFDDRGRVYSNSNSSYAFVDLWPVEYFRRGANAGAPVGQPRMRARNLAPSEAVHSIRVNTGINRGYHDHMLREDGRLARTTAVSGGTFLRGAQLGPELVGDLFIPEPAGNLVAHFRIDEADDGLSLRGEQALTPDETWGERAFLASTDERFRPVDCIDGPDGALYVVDLYRGIIQHRQFVTSYLRKQIEERGLDTPIGLGRIWRVVREDRPIDRTSPIGRFATLAACIESLSHESGWVRDTAQRILTEGLESRELGAHGGIEAGVEARIAALHRRVAGGPSDKGKVHALRTLAELRSRGYPALDPGLLSRAAGDAEREVRIAALRALEAWIAAVEPREGETLLALLDLVEAGLDHDDRVTRVQAAFTFGEVGPRVERALPPTDPAAARPRTLLLRALATHPEDRWLAAALLSGRAGSLGADLEWLAAARLDRTAPVAAPLRYLAETATAAALDHPRSSLPALLGLVDRSAAADPEAARAILSGIRRATGRRGFPMVDLSEVPPTLRDVARSPLGPAAEGDWREIARRIRVTETERPPRERPSEPPAVLQRRRSLYSTCAMCHGPTGEGLAGLGPTLRGAPRVTDPARTPEVVRTILDGLTGPLEVDGLEWNATMPGLRGADAFDDAAIADVVNHLRRGLDPDGPGADAPLVTAEEVARVRNATVGRQQPWTDRELRTLAERAPMRLFDGVSLDGWSKHGGAATYKVEDGCIVGVTAPNTPNTFLCTDRAFADFELTYEFQVDPVLNSGVQIRSRIDGGDRVRGYQVEIDVDPFRARYWSGGIYEEGGRGWLDDLSEDVDARMAARPEGWNPVRVRARGGRIEVWIHGRKTADLLDAEALEGIVGLQVHGVGSNPNPLRVRWRNLELRPLGRSVWEALPLERSAQLLEGNHWSRVEDGWRGAAGGPPILLSTPTEESPSVHRVAGTLEPGAALLLDGVRFDASGVHVECFEGGANRTIDLADGISTDPSGRVTIPTTVILRDGGRLVVTQAGRRLIECGGVEAPRALTVAGEGGEARLTTLDRLAPRRAGE